MDIARATENIDDLTKKSKDLDEKLSEVKEKSKVSIPKGAQPSEEAATKNSSTEVVEINTEILNKENTCTEKEPNDVVEVEIAERKSSTSEGQKILQKEDFKKPVKKDGEEIQVEYRRASQENIEIIKDIDQVNSLSELDNVCLRRKSSSSSLSRSSSFSVKDEIEKIEKQIKALETKNASKDSSDERNNLQENVRHSIQENRRHFFQNMVDNENDKDAIKIEFKELPREQKDIHVVRLNDSPVPTIAPREPVKVIELHISEPIRQKPEILEDVNPIPKPRRHSALTRNDSQPTIISNETRRNLKSTRGKSF